MRSSLTLLFSTLVLCLAVAPAQAVTVASTDPTGSFYDLFFDAYDSGFPTTNGDNLHEAVGTEFKTGLLYTTDLLYTSIGGREGTDGYSLILDESFTPDGFGGGVMHFNIDNSNHSGQPMFPGVGASVDEAYLEIIFWDFSASVVDVQYSIDGTARSDAAWWTSPPSLPSDPTIDLGLDWPVPPSSPSPELAGAQSIQVDVTIAPVPEPTSLALVGSLAAGLFGLRRHLV